MKRVIEKIVALSLLIGIMISFGSQTILQGINILTYAKTFNYEANNILESVFEEDGLTILPFVFKDRKETIKKTDIIEIFKTEGEEITNAEELKDIIVTGDKIKTSSKTYTVLIYGDVDADGLITVFDAQMALRHFVGSNNVNLAGVFEMAANVYNDDDVVDTFDAQRILRFYVGNVDKLLLKDLEIVVPEKPTLNKVIFGDKENPVTSDTVKVNETIKRQIYFVDKDGVNIEIPANKVKITSTEDIEVTLLDEEGETILSTSEEAVKKIGIKGLRAIEETDLTIAVEGYETKGITVKIAVKIDAIENMTVNEVTLSKIVTENNGVVTKEPIPEEGLSVFVDSNQKIDVQFKHIYNSDEYTDLYVAANRITVEPEISDNIDVQLQKSDGTEAVDDDIVRIINIRGKAETNEDISLVVKVDGVELSTLKVKVKATNVVLNITEPTDGLVNLYLNRAPEGNDMVVNPVNTREIYTLLETKVLKDGESILTLGDITSGKMKVTITGRFGVQINSDWIKLQGIVSGDGKKYIPPTTSTKIEYLGIGLDDTKINTTEAIDLVNRLGEEGGKISISYTDAKDSFEFGAKIIISPAIKTELEEIEADMTSKGITDLDDYTDETSVKFRELRRYASMTVLQVNYDKVAQELTEAYNNLVLAEVTKTELEIAKAAINAEETAKNKIFESDYTVESWSILTKAIEKAEEADRNSKYNAIKSDLDLTKLVPARFETPELDTANTAKETLQESDYTEESWKKFTDAITEATAAILKSQYKKIVEEGYLNPSKLVERIYPISEINTTLAEPEDIIENIYYRLETYGIEVASGEKQEKIEEGTITKWEILKKSGEEYVALNETTPEATIEETVVEGKVIGNFTAKVVGEYKVTPIIEGATEAENILGTPVEIKVEENQTVNKIVIKNMKDEIIPLDQVITAYIDYKKPLKIEFWHDYKKAGKTTEEDAKKLEVEKSRIILGLGEEGQEALSVGLRTATGEEEAQNNEIIESIILTGMTEVVEKDITITIDENVAKRKHTEIIKIKVDKQRIEIEEPTEILNLYKEEQENNNMVVKPAGDNTYTYSLLKLTLNGELDKITRRDFKNIADVTEGLTIKIVSTNPDRNTGEELNQLAIIPEGFIEGETEEAKKIIPENQSDTTIVRYIGIAIDEELATIVDTEEEVQKQLQIIEDLKAGKAKIVVSYAGISETVEIGVKLNVTTVTE